MRCRSRANSRSRGPRPRAARQKAANGGEQPAVEADGAICAELRTGPKLAPRLAQASIGETGVEVNRALEGGGTEITVTKPRAGRRFIDLTAETLDMVRHYAEHHAVKNSYDLVFPTSSGRWQSIRNWRNRGFSRVCEEAGLMVEEKEGSETVLRPKYKPYDLRHFYASMLIDRRVNLERIQTLMGHRNIQTTLNVYGHLIERAEAPSDSRTSVLSFVSRNSVNGGEKMHRR
jgi:integrase